MLQYQHLARSCVTCVPHVQMAPLVRSDPGGPLPNAIWQMDVTPYPAFGNLRYVHVVVDTTSAFIYAVAMADKKASRAIKVMKSAMLVMGAPWEVTTDMALPTHLNRSEPSYPHGGAVPPL